MSLHRLEIYRITVREMRMSSALKNQNKSKHGQGIESMQITALAHGICSGSGIYWSRTSQFSNMIPIIVKLPMPIRH